MAIETWRGEDPPPNGQGWKQYNIGRGEVIYQRATPEFISAPAPAPAPAPALPLRLRLRLPLPLKGIHNSMFPAILGLK